MSKKPLELLVVDGYNVIFKTPRYTGLMDTPPAKALSADPFDRARELLISDVAAYAQRRFEPVIVFDGSGNVSPDRPNLTRAGVQLIFSKTGESADSVIERLVVQCRLEERDVTVVSSDNTIRATVGGIPVTRVSSTALISDVQIDEAESQQTMADQGRKHLTVADRLDAATIEKLNKLLGK